MSALFGAGVASYAVIRNTQTATTIEYVNRDGETVPVATTQLVKLEQSTSYPDLTLGRLCLYIAVMAVVTYLIRMIPFTLFRKEIRSTFFRSFLAYVPYAVLGAMTFPSIFYATASLPSAIAGTAVALVLAFFRRSLLTVAVGASGAALAIELVVMYLL